MADMHMTGRSGPKGLIFRLLPVVSCLMMASGQAAGGEKIELPAQKTGIQIVSAGKGDAIAELGARIVEASFRALRKDGAPVSISLTWIDDRQLHLDPLLSRKVFDMGIAWQKPQCDDSALAGRDRHLCEGFFFSKPFITVTERFYIKAAGADSANTREFTGRRVCVSRDGYRDLSRRFEVMKSATPAGCFAALQAGWCDAVIASEKDGRDGVASGRIVALKKPFSVKSYHAIIAKSHIRARTYLYYFNTAVARLKKSPRYREIVSGHAETVAAGR